ncbi:glycosyl hydrolase family 18 protein [Anoxynatronum buryatiense]|uniref:Copper amine oxidase N-terminal domain-containing protein n=1 Tax=Anoxynatronum buryatiense TaxID=489973 RepID=A0AA45WT70_9CLOT|nr:glycosyl hydrolase family 18 protein [Anoxynatronum buryatiense]SMP38014.1 Copper amine oxidase N-terminal domain-containing protein [Anoxynatronum buryatiense]
MKKLGIFFLLLAMAASAFYGYMHFWPSSETALYNATGIPQVYYEGHQLDLSEPYRMVGNEVLVSLELAEIMTNVHYYWDRTEETLVATTYDYVYRFQPGRDFLMENGRPVDLPIPMTVEGNVPYLPVAFLNNHLSMEWQLRQEDQVLVIEEKRPCRMWAEVITEAPVMRQAPAVKAPMFEETLVPGDRLMVYETYEKWLKVRNEAGLIGYIQKKDVRRYEECAEISTRSLANRSPRQDTKGKISLVWEHVHQVNPSTAGLVPLPGVDVVSPTWYEIADESGAVSSNISQAYLNWALTHGYEVWPLVSNGFNPDRTSAFLASTSIRETIIDQLLESVLQHGMHGLNIDFENVYLDDRDHVTQFVRELTPLFREAGLVVSMDVTIRSTSEMWSMFYDREALGEIVDYIVVMTYDQHWGSSPVAGSVAQYQWVENGIKGILEQVPAEKVLLGLPFYTRMWEEKEVDGQITVSSQALSMNQVQQIITGRNLEVVWEEESGQYYTEYTEGGSRFRIWVEDARSIDLKSSLVHRHQLAGTASWRRGFESQEIWGVLAHNLKEMDDYVAWAHARQEWDRIF